MDNNIKIFDRNLVKLHRHRAAKYLSNHDFLITQASELLTERLEDISRTHNTALNLGCHTGQLTKILTQKNIDIKTIIQTDICSKMIGQTTGHRVVVDEEYLPFSNNSFDLVTSRLSLHWVNDLPGTLTQIRQILKPNGLFIANMLGGETLTELRQVITKIELEERNGVSPRISPFVEVKSLGSLLQRAGFDMPVCDFERITVSYPNIFHLVKDLRFMGETSSPIRKAAPLNKTTWHKISSEYTKNFSDGEGGIIATFDIITITGLAPSKNK